MLLPSSSSLGPNHQDLRALLPLRRRSRIRRDGSNPSTSASYRFDADGTWIGGAYQGDPAATEFMHGSYSIHNGIVTLSGYGMGPQCGGTVVATYALTLDPACQQMEFLTKTDGCTGARLYLSAADNGTTFTRRN